MSDAWTFSSIPFIWLREATNGHPARPTWKRQPRLVERPLLDSGDADFARVGFTAWKISGPIYIEAASAAAFLALNGDVRTLSDGTTTWTAILSLDADELAPDGAGYSGTATFTRPRA
jgi:hypothetical protein